MDLKNNPYICTILYKFKTSIYEKGNVIVAYHHLLPATISPRRNHSSWTTMVRHRRQPHQCTRRRCLVARGHLLLVWRTQVRTHKQCHGRHYVLCFYRPNHMEKHGRGVACFARERQRTRTRLHHGTTESDIQSHDKEVRDVFSFGTQAPWL